MKTLQRFTKKFIVNNKTNCWEWIACIHPNGYGQFLLNNKKCAAHRVSYELHVGKIPDDLLVCHTCDVKNCVNPNHLFLGTQQENVDDMIKKGRANKAKGSKSGNAKLNESQARVIKKLLASISVKEVAGLFSASKNTVHRIKNGTHWSCG